MEIAVEMHLNVSELTLKYEKELRSYYYVTPTSYLELLETFKKLLINRQTNSRNMIERYEAGINKIMDTEVRVGEMQKQLEDL